MNLINGETISLVLFFIGVYGLIARRNIIKSIMSISIMQVAIILYFISSEPGSLAPIGDLSGLGPIADPLPQALMITEIVIGIGVTAASLILFIHLYHQYGTSNWEKVKKKRKDHD